MLLPVVFAALALSGGAGPQAAAPKPVAARCAYGLGLVLQPPGLLGVYMYRVTSGLQLQQSTQLATVSRAGGTLGAACDRVKALSPKRPTGLAGPWPLQRESKIYCAEGGTLQIRPLVSKGRVVGTRVLLLRKDLEGTTVHALDGRHVIVDVSLRARGGGLSFDPTYCDRNAIP